MDIYFIIRPIGFLLLVILLLSVNLSAVVSAIQRQTARAWNMLHRTILAQFLREFYKLLLHPKVAVGFISLLLGGTVLNMLYAHKYTLVYIVLVWCGLWGILSWLTSKFLRSKKPQQSKNPQKSKSSRKAKASNAPVRSASLYWLWKWSIITIIAIFTLVAVYYAYDEQDQWELSQYEGMLKPGKKPAPASPCNSQIPKSAVAVYLGRSVVWFTHSFLGTGDEENFRVIDAPQLDTPDDGNLLLGISKHHNDNTISITADLRDQDLKLVALIDHNSFQLVRNNTSFMRRSLDRTTLTITDSYDKVLEIEYLNPTAIKISGRLYFGKDSYAEIGDAEMRIFENGQSNRMDGCFPDDGDPSRAGLFAKIRLQ